MNLNNDEILKLAKQAELDCLAIRSQYDGYIVELKDFTTLERLRGFAKLVVDAEFEKNKNNTVYQIAQRAEAAVNGPAIGVAHRVVNIREPSAEELHLAKKYWDAEAPGPRFVRVEIAIDDTPPTEGVSPGPLEKFLTKDALEKMEVARGKLFDSNGLLKVEMDPIDLVKSEAPPHLDSKRK